MAFLNKFTIRDFAKERYLALVRSYPRLTEEKTQIYLMLSLTFASLSFLGIFAISPTLTTIVELNKKLADSIFVDQSLQTKLTNLSMLHTQYESLSQTWPIVNSVIPNDPQVVLLLGKIHAIAINNNVLLTNLQANQIKLSSLTPHPKYQKEANFIFTITAFGQTENLVQFVKTISQFDRVVLIEAINYVNEGKQSVTVRARAFYIP
jgi:Tfp pilus assembly protein PilO